MSVTRDDVDRISELARLRLDEDEAERLTAEMNRILEHADRLRAVDARAATGTGSSNAEPEGRGGDAPAVVGDAAGAVPEASATREGVAGARRAGADRPDPLVRGPEGFAPRFEDGFFVVPPPHGVQADT